MKKRRGFTLIELLIVVSILGMVMIAITQSLGSVLSGSGKANALQTVKENGQFSIATIERLTRSARAISCTIATPHVARLIIPAASWDDTYIVQRNGTTRQLELSSNNGTTFTALTGPDVTVDSFSCTVANGTIAGQPQVATFILTLSKPGLAVDQQVLSQTFQTTVSLRTY